MKVFDNLEWGALAGTIAYGLGGVVLSISAAVLGAIAVHFVKRYLNKHYK